MPESLDDRSGQSNDAPALAYADPATPHPQQFAPVSRWDVAVIVVRLIGVYFVVVLGLSYLIATLRILADGIWRLTWLYFALSTGFVAIGVVLFLAAGRAARWLLPQSSSVPPAANPASPTTVQEIAFSVVGVYLVVVDAIPGLALQTWRWLSETQAGAAAIQTRLPQYGPYLFEHLVQLVVGVLLFRGSKRLSDYWHRTRSRQPESGEEGGPL